MVKQVSNLLISCLTSSTHLLAGLIELLSYLITSNNLFYYSSARVYTVFCCSEKLNFRQICVRNDVIFQNKKGIHVLFFIRNKLFVIRNPHHYKKSGLDKFPKCVCVCVCLGGLGRKMNMKRMKEEGFFLKRAKAYKGGRGRGSKIVKFERTYFLNDPEVFSCFQRL